MPQGDRTGPMGMGPMTGRVAGLCDGSNISGYENQIQSRGFGRRRNFRGFRQTMLNKSNNTIPFSVKTQENSEDRFLQKQIYALKTQLSEIKTMIDKINN